MATIADFYSSNLASEVVKGMTQKAKTGGTITRAPLGYVNHHELVDGHDIRWVDIDEARADLVKLAFKLYATGDYSLVALAKLLAKKGLLSRATKRHYEHKLTKTTLAQMLANPYYTGVTIYQGVQYPGKHPALITTTLFRQVQDILKSRLIGEKQRVHLHYLKGTVYCGRCGSQLCLTYQKQQYLYYFCLGRAKGNGCALPYLKADEIEIQIAQHYSLIKLTKAEADQVRNEVHAYIKDNQADFTSESKRQRLILEQLEAEHAKLLKAYYARVMPLDVFGTEQGRITTAKQRATETLAAADQGFDNVAVKLDQALDLMRNWRDLYEEAPRQFRRKLNQAFFECVYIQESDELVTTNGSKLTKPFAGIMALSGRPKSGLAKTSYQIRKNQPVRLVPSNIPVFYTESSKAEPLVVLCGQLRNWDTNTFE
jgi:hypothetical protein